MKRGAWHDFGGQHPWHSIDQTPPKLAWPNAPGWPPADALTPPEPKPLPPAPAFAPNDPVRVRDTHDPWYDRDGIIHSGVGDERGAGTGERYIVEFEKGDPNQRGVYDAHQLEKRQ